MTKVIDLELSGEELEVAARAIQFYNDEQGSTLPSLVFAQKVDDALDVFYGRTPDDDDDDFEDDDLEELLEAL